MIINSFIEVLTFLIISFIIVLILNYLFNKDFKKLISKIKRIAFSPRKTNKAIQIINEIENYFFD